MLKTMLKYALFLVGGHLILGVGLIVTEAVHGISDQDASFAIALFVYYLNPLAVWLLKLLGLSQSAMSIVLVGILQWTALSAILAAIHCGFRAVVKAKGSGCVGTQHTGTVPAGNNRGSADERG